MRISDWSSDVCSSDLISCAERRIQIFISKADTALHKESEADDPWCVREALRIAAAEKRPKRICGLLIVPELVAMMVVYEIERFDSEIERMVVYASKPGGIDIQCRWIAGHRSEEHTSELQSLIRSSYAVFCLKKKKKA